jgi:hypothetical protein
MLRFIAKRYAKVSYHFRQLKESATNDLMAAMAFKTAEEHRTFAVQLNKDADEIEKRIADFTEQEKNGYWQCENGHEIQFTKSGEAVEQLPGDAKFCIQCGSPTKLIKRDQMTPQEQYESDKERKEAQKIADQKRQQAKGEEEDAGNSEKTARYFKELTDNNRKVADKIRKL